MLSRVGYFGGSNALWRTDVLKQYPFDSTMHCEDVDLSARVILDGHRILFCPHARSGALSPQPSPNPNPNPNPIPSLTRTPTAAVTPAPPLTPIPAPNPNQASSHPRG